MKSRKYRVRDESEIEPSNRYPCADDLDILILGLMCDGMPDAAIGRKLGVSLRTVQRRIGRMMEETESPSRFAFGVTLYRMGVVCEPRLASMRTAIK